MKTTISITPNEARLLKAAMRHASGLTDGSWDLSEIAEIRKDYEREIDGRKRRTMRGDFLRAAADVAEERLILDAKKP